MRIMRDTGSYDNSTYQRASPKIPQDNSKNRTELIGNMQINEKWQYNKA